MGEVVAGVDDKIGLERCEAPYPARFPPLPRREVHVGEVQHPQRLGVALEDRNADSTQPVLVGLPQRVGETGGLDSAQVATRVRVRDTK